MYIEHATPQDGPDSEYLWLHDGGLPRPREDRVAEIIALVALLFSLSVGLVIALLPVSAKAAAATQASREPSGMHVVMDAGRRAARDHRAAHGRG